MTMGDQEKFPEQVVSLDDTPWQRVSPLSIIFLFLSSTLNFLRYQIFSAGPLVIAAFYFSENAIGIIVLATLGMVGFFLVRSCFFYLFFTFRVMSDRVLIRQGILNRENLDLHFGRIQNVSISVPFYYVPFEIVNCRLDSAGSEGSEAYLPGVTREVAEDIQARVLTYQDATGIAPAPRDLGETGELPVGEEPLVTLAPLEGAIVGFVNARVLALAIFIAATLERFLEQFDMDLTDLAGPLSSLLPDRTEEGSFTVYVVLFAIVAAILFVGSSIRAFIQYYGFLLFEDGPRLKKVAGLFERHTTSLTTSKVQGVTVGQNIRAMVLGRIWLRFHQTSQQVTDGGAGDFVIPLLRKRQWPEFVRLAFPDFAFENKTKFQRPDRRYITRNFTLFAMPLILIATGIWNLTLTDLTMEERFYPLALAVPLWLFALLSWLRKGVWHDEEYVVVREGFISVHYTVFPIYKIQQVIEIHTPMQQSQGLKDLGVQLAFGRVRVRWLKAAQVEGLMNRFLAEVETSKRSWI